MKNRADPTGRHPPAPAERIRARQPLARLIAQIAAAGEEAPFWAEHCGWIPGTGHCRRAADAGCGGLCLFAAEREAEADAVALRRRRRRSQPIAD